MIGGARLDPFNDARARTLHPAPTRRPSLIEATHTGVLCALALAIAALFLVASGGVL